MYANIACKITLPTGQTVSLYEGDYGGPSSQTISYIAAKDTTDPVGTLVDSAGNPTSFTRTLWSNQSLTVGVKCANDPQNTDACTCAGVDSDNTLLQGNWASNTLTDTNIFTRTFSADGRYTGNLWVLDNATNDSAQLPVSFGIDKTRPVIERTAGKSFMEMPNGNIRITATDALS